jgi:hypothetical protein
MPQPPQPPRRLLDRRRNLLPRDYLTDPYQFGTHPAPTWTIPAGGDRVSRDVARVQHEIVLLLHAHAPRAGARAARRFGFSRQLFSKAVHGSAWMGETILAASIWTLLDTIRTRD